VVPITATGYNQTLYWGGETAYGSAAVIDEPVGLVQSINPTETNNLIKVKTLGGTRDYASIVPGKFEVTGSFEYYLQDGVFLRQAFGEDTCTTATVDSGPKFHTGAATYLHCMGSADSPAADDFPSFSLELTDYEDSGAAADTANLKRVYDGCRVNTLKIAGTIDAPITVSVDYIGQGVNVSTAGPTAVSESTEDPFVFYQGQVYCTSGAITAETSVVTGSKVCEVNSFDYSINNNLEAVWYISGTCAKGQSIRGLKKLLIKGRDHEATLGLHFKNKAMYQRFLGSNTATSSSTTLNKYQVALDFVRKGTIGAATKLATDNFVRLVLGSCAFNTANIAGAPEDIVAQPLDLAVKSAKLFVVDDDASYT